MPPNPIAEATAANTLLIAALAKILETRGVIPRGTFSLELQAVLDDPARAGRVSLYGKETLKAAIAITNR